jgi:hypothetical protein
MCLSGVTTNGYLDPPAGNRLGVGQVTLLINRVAHHVVRGLVLQSLLDSTELGIMMVENVWFDDLRATAMAQAGEVCDMVPTHLCNRHCNCCHTGVVTVKLWHPSHQCSCL